MNSRQNMVIFIRHGESESNVAGVLTHDVTGYPLTMKGIGQAQKVSKVLMDLAIDQVYCSPLLRTTRTAEIIAQDRGLAVNSDARLRESGMGKLNKTRARTVTDAERKEFEMEPWEDIVSRMKQFAESCTGISVAVSHALPIRALVSDTLGMDDASTHGVNIGFCSITAFATVPMRVLSIGSRSLPQAVIGFAGTG